MENELQLFINIPFRPAGCERTDFGALPYDQTMLKAYGIALEREIRAAGPEMDDYTVRSIRFGGGTTPVITVRVLRTLLGAVRESFRCAADMDISAECVPASLTELFCVGMNHDGPIRLDCRLDTVHNSEWLRLGLPYDYTQSLQQMDTALTHFRPARLTLSAAYGFAGQRQSSLDTTLNRILALHPDSVRLLPDSQPTDEAEALYQYAAEKLGSAGCRRCALREFALPGGADAFTRGTLNGVERLGLGLGARSWYDGIVYRNTADPVQYLDHSAELSAVARDIRPADEGSLAVRDAVLRLMSADGLSAEAVPAALTQRFSELSDNGMLMQKDGVIYPTVRGIVRWDTLGL